MKQHFWLQLVSFLVLVLHTDTFVCVSTWVILTRVVLVRWLAPSQTDSSTSALSVNQPGCWLRRWGSVRFPWRGTDEGRVSASHRNTGRPPRQVSHSSDSTTRHLVGYHVRIKLVSHHRWNQGKNREKTTSTHLPLPDSLSTVTTRPSPLDTRWAISGGAGNRGQAVTQTRNNSSQRASHARRDALVISWLILKPPFSSWIWKIYI